MRALNILIAEDNDDHAEMIVDSLEDFNSENTVKRVENGDLLIHHLDALKADRDTGAEMPDLILLDIKMPVLDGIGVLKIIKQDAAFKKIPVMMLSTSDSEIDVKKCYRLGANSYIIKPFDYSEFSEKIRNLNAFWATLSKIPSK